MNNKLLLYIMASIGVVSLSDQAIAATLTVDGQANIYGSGHSIAPDPNGGGGGILPPSYTFSAGVGHILEFSSVLGDVACYGSMFNGPDGGSNASGTTDILSYGGISGIINSDHTMFLVGVFTDGTEPIDPAPVSLDFSGAENFTSLNPLLNQVFYIGDGLTGTGSGAIQQFIVPPTATTLYLGFADSWDFGDPESQPGSYGDNSGSLNATFNIRGVPDAGSTLALLGSAFAMLGMAGRKLRN